MANDTFIWIVLAGLFVFLLARILPIFLSVWALRIHRPSVERLSALPEAIALALAPTLKALEPLGFSQPVPVKIDGIAYDLSLGYHLVGDMPGTYATVSIASVPSQRSIPAVSFLTLYADGAVRHTLQGLGLQTLPMPPEVSLTFVATRDPVATWQAHYANLIEAAPKAPLATVTGSAALALVNEGYYPRLLAHLIASDRVVPAGPEQPGTYHCRLPLVFKLAWQIFAGRSQTLRAIRQVRGESPPVPLEIDKLPLDYEIELYERQRRRRARRPTAGGRLALLLGSLLLFILSFLLLLELPELLILLVALVIHEGGHLLALKLRGFQNLNLLFLPFLGAVAAGQKEAATLFDRMFVVFMGPLPGLLIALALLALIYLARQTSLLAISPRQLQTLWTIAFYFTLLNGFNLLPFFPLDGGQVVQRILLARAPVIDAFVRAGAVLAFAGFGALSGDLILIFFAVLFGLASSSFWRQLGQRRRIVNAFTTSLAAATDPAREAFAAIRQAGYGASLSFPEKYAFATQLLEIYRDRHEGWLVRAMYLIIYAIAIALTVINVTLALIISR